MASQTSSGQASMSPQDLYMRRLSALFADYDKAGTESQRKQVMDEGIKVLRSMGINDAITDSLEQIAKMGPETIKSAMQLINTTTQSQIQKKQELEAKKEQILFELTSKPAQTRAGMASLFVAIAVIARAFGADEFADEMEQKAKAEMDKIPSSVKVGTNITNGSDDVAQTLATQLGMLRTSGGAATAAGADAARVGYKTATGPDLTGGGQSRVVAQDVPAQSSGRTKMTWSQFREDALRVGVKEDTLKQVLSLFDKSAEADKRGDSKVLDTSMELGKLKKSVDNSGLKRADPAFGRFMDSLKLDPSYTPS